MKQIKLKTNILEDLFLLGLGVLSFLSWAYEYEVWALLGCILLAVVIIFILKKSLYLIALIPFMLLMVNDTPNKEILLWLIAIECIVILVADYLKHYQTIKLGMLGIPLLLMIVTMALSLINTPLLRYSLYEIMYFIGAFIIYLYVRNTVNINHQEENQILISKVITYASLTYLAQFAYFVITKNTIGNELLQIRNGSEWSLSYGFIPIILFSIPFVIYYASKLKIKMMILMIALLEAIALLLFIQSGEYLALAIISIPLILFAIYRDDNKLNMAVQGVLTFSILLPIAYILYTNNRLDDIISRYKDLTFYTIDLSSINVALNEFSRSTMQMVFGRGINTLTNNLAGYYPNIFINALVMTGIVGLIALLYFMIQAARVMFKNDAYHIFLSLGFIGTLMYGIINQSIYYPIFLAFILPAFAVAEVYIKKEKAIEPIEQIEIKEPAQAVQEKEQAPKQAKQKKKQKPKPIKEPKLKKEPKPKKERPKKETKPQKEKPKRPKKIQEPKQEKPKKQKKVKEPRPKRQKKVKEEKKRTIEENTI